MAVKTVIQSLFCSNKIHINYTFTFVTDMKEKIDIKRQQQDIYTYISYKKL